jgi:hypothetical protein
LKAQSSVRKKQRIIILVSIVLFWAFAIYLRIFYLTYADYLLEVCEIGIVVLLGIAIIGIVAKVFKIKKLGYFARLIRNTRRETEVKTRTTLDKVDRTQS